MTDPRREELERILSKISTGKNCWEWKAYKKPSGYGICQFRKKVQMAHRAMYELFVEDIPIGKQIDHLCRNRSCVRPSHLEVVDQRTNILRGNGYYAVNSRKTTCPKGHLYTSENTKIQTSDSGKERICRICHRRRKRNYRFMKRRESFRVLP